MIENNDQEEFDYFWSDNDICQESLGFIYDDIGEKCFVDNNEEFVEFTDRLKSIDETFLIAENAQYVAVDKNKSVVTHIKKPENSNKNFRKTWGIVDSTDVSNFDELLPESDRAMVHPYELDDFQKRAILRLHQNQHVLVCAHTASGKTTVADYAIALCKKRKHRVIYTAPIKALSNQKYREFSQIFDSVGIITGDVSTNRDAECLIITTEILRNFLYRSDPMLNHVEIIIFDEIHYITDFERGFVWEESIILLPPHLTMVMLSATIPNYQFFADWIGQTKQREIFIMLTKKRIIPLEHYIFHGEKAYRILDANNNFEKDAYSKIFEDRKNASLNPKNQTKNKNNEKLNLSSKNLQNQPAQLINEFAQKKTEKHRLQSFVNYLEKINGLPAVIFCFNRQKCENFASSLARLSSVTSKMNSASINFINKSLKDLSENDKHLPQIEFIKMIVDKGIGVHHSGLLPIVKEIIELLFSQNLIQLLIATETFAMGINMPTKSVLVTSLQKPDGKNIRYLNTNEYIQIAGRAGRRGKDTSGKVFIFSPFTDPPPINLVHSILLNKPLPVESKFRLTLSMIMELSVRNSIKPDAMIRKTFMEAFKTMKTPKLKKEYLILTSNIDELEAELVNIPERSIIKNYVQNFEKSYHQSLYVHSMILNSKIREEFFKIGRVILINFKPDTLSTFYAIILELDSQKTFKLLILQDSNQNLEDVEVYVGNLITEAAKNEHEEENNIINFNETFNDMVKFKHDLSQTTITDCNKSSDSNIQKIYVIQKIPLKNISILFDKVIDIKLFEQEEANVNTQDSLYSFGNTTKKSKKKVHLVQEKQRVILSANSLNSSQKNSFNQHKNGFYIRLSFHLSEIIKKNNLTQYKIKNKHNYLSIDHIIASDEYEVLNDEILKSKSIFQNNYDYYINKEVKLNDMIKRKEQLSFDLSNDSLYLLTQFNSKTQILKDMGYISETGSATLKGRAACEILIKDEIALVEAYFDNVFANIDIPEIAAVIAMFVYPNQKSSTFEFEHSFELQNAVNRVMSFHQNYIDRCIQEKITVDVDFYEQICNKNFVDLALKWASGMPFTDLMTFTDIHEGTIVQAILRINDLAKKLRNVSHALKNDELCKKFQKVMQVIHRDIVFTQSLYIQ